MHRLLENVKPLDTSILLIGNKGLYQEADAQFLAVKLLGTTPRKLDSHPDFLSVSCGKEKSMGVDVAEAIIRKTAYLPVISDKIVILISEIDRMTEQAQNKLLKTIEECRHVVVIATAYSNNVLATIRSRCRIIEYRPLTEDEFHDACEQMHIEDVDTLYYVTNGCPGLIDENSNVLQLFKAVAAAIAGYHLVSLLSILHMAEEKDPESFFTRYPEYIRNLLAMMYSCFTRILQRETDSNAVARGPINKFKIERILGILEKNLAVCTSSTYTKDNFFLCIAGIIQISIGGLV